VPELKLVATQCDKLHFHKTLATWWCYSNMCDLHPHNSHAYNCD